MNVWPAFSRSELVGRFGLKCIWVLAFAIPALSAAWLWYDDAQRSRMERAIREMGSTNLDAKFEALTSIAKSSWAVLVPVGQPSDLPSRLVTKWRLAGTFFAFPESGQSQRKAILDNVAENRQTLVAEGDNVDDFEVTRISVDHVIVQTTKGQDVLWLSFASKREDTQSADKAAEAVESSPSFEKSKFGTRVGERRWVMNRNALMDYYAELRENPERIAKLYISLKPDWTDDGQISGYRLDPIGEEDFFNAAGLEPGDVVRKVNSLEMTSQGRAEYFISEFLQGRLNAVVLDIERNGQPEKLIYLIR